MINPHVLPGNIGPFTVRRAVLTPRARRGRVISFDAATWKAVVQLDGALAAMPIKVADWVNPAALIADAMVAVTLFNDSNPDDGLVLGTYGNVGGFVFSDAEGDPAPTGVAADGASNYSARRDHVHLDPVTAHAAAGDPHTVYALDTDLSTHAGAADPHTGYRLESADHTHASTGAEAGTLAHSVLTSVSADQHHAQAHAIGGADHTLAGGVDGYVLKATGATTQAYEEDLAAIEFIIDGGGSAITTGQKGHLEIPFACVIQRMTTLADQSGSIVVDIWKDTYAAFPPTVLDTITASAKPTLAAAQKAQDSTLTGWTTTIAAGDVLAYNVDSATTVTRVVISLKVRKT